MDCSLEQMDFNAYLQSITENKFENLSSLHKLCQSGDARDVEWNRENLVLFADLLPVVWRRYVQAKTKPERTVASECIHTANEIFFIVIQTPEFHESNGVSVFGEAWRKALFERLEMCSISDEIELNYLKNCLHWTYSTQVESRPFIKPWIGHVLINFANNPTKSLAVSSILEVLADIIRGFHSPLTDTQRKLFILVLLPLHRPNRFFEWRDQLPILQLYHRPLVMCLLLFLEKDPSLLTRLIDEIVEVWPEGFNSNTAKEVILLHEYEMLLDSGITATNVKLTFPPMLPKIATCIASENWRLNEKVLGLWRNKTFVTVLCDESSSEFFPPILAALLRGGTPHWNPTVRRMTSLVLETMQEKAPMAFSAATDLVWGNNALPVSAASLLMKGDPHVHHSKAKAVDIDVIQEAVVFEGKGGQSKEADVNTIIEEHNHTGFPIPAARPPKNQPGSIRPGAPVKLASLGTLPAEDNSMLKIPGRVGSNGSSLQTGKGLSLTAAPWAAKTSGNNSLPQAGAGGGSVAVRPTEKGPSSAAAADKNIMHLPPRSIGGGSIEAHKGHSMTAAPWAGGGDDPIEVTNSAIGLSHETSILEDEEEEEAAEGKKIDEKPEDAMLQFPPRGATLEGGKGFSLTAAPWAQNSKTDVLPHKRKGGGEAHLIHLTEKTHEEEEAEEEEDEKVVKRLPQTSVERMQQYMDACKPDEDESDNTKSWITTQMAATPTLLPSLKFHDLVFGNELGKGSFSTVKYARQIVRFDQPVIGETPEEATARERRAQKQKGRSVWPEYAVKVISTEKIKELGYEQNVVREIAVLRNLSHPGIARLVSCFRWRDGVYLVLEYAAKGDLHNLITTNGSLDLKSARFVIGEIIAALSSIHDVGLVFGDLKPENILITEGGHIKLTDFGGCRPLSQTARDVLSASKSQLGSLRDGDWRAEEERSSANVSKENEIDDGAWNTALLNEDGRVEGTVAYCAPEIVTGESLPYVSSDVWSLGCVAYFILRGRLPFFHDTVEGLKHHIVNFVGEDFSNNADASTSSTTVAGLDYPIDSFSKVSKEFVSKLLQPDPTSRLSLPSAAHHTFFTDFGVDVFSLHLHEPYPLHTGSTAPPPADAKWARRQHSHIWAPELATYDFSSGKDKKCADLGFYSGTSFEVEETEFDLDLDFFGAPKRKQLQTTSSIPALPPLSE